MQAVAPRERDNFLSGRALWIVQVPLALAFLLAGGIKLVMPAEALRQVAPVPGLFLRFIGLAEVVGGIGLILPGLLRIRPGLTVVAAAGLVVIMGGATFFAVAGGDTRSALLPLALGLLSALVAYGRWRLAPILSRREGGSPLWRQVDGHRQAGRGG